MNHRIWEVLHPFRDLFRIRLTWSATMRLFQSSIDGPNKALQSTLLILVKLEQVAVLDDETCHVPEN